jgi:CRISPR/Cas system-associated exonuclease Cas4 (RecB family)
MAGLVKSWSYSTYNNFNRCPKRVYLEKVLKVPQPPLVIPEGKLEHPMSRGNRIHESAELYITDDLELIPELEQFRLNFEAMRRLKSSSEIFIEVEGDWAYTENWEVTNWRSDNAWLRMKADMILVKGDEAILIDYKSGKRYGNEISHMTQAQLYQMCAFIRFPELENIVVEFWYTDVGGITKANFTRDFGMQFLPIMEKKGREVTEEINFNPKPSSYACGYCPYGTEQGNGECPAAYSLLRK